MEKNFLGVKAYITVSFQRPFNPSCTDKYAALPGHLNCEDLGHLTGKPIPLPDSGNT
ncbi:hypothetical protein DPMN_189554 [Dreissena polymorpha]|uniref:Uncharacterized protein n=1 Tax=Dreissena polymorpha TaxID=45954 RepID=A0A9D4I9L2_DREPO|nr:hypothetical protein DPMN_189554 [Dreissena polymorpha]